MGTMQSPQGENIIWTRSVTSARNMGKALGGDRKAQWERKDMILEAYQMRMNPQKGRGGNASRENPKIQPWRPT